MPDIANIPLPEQNLPAEDREQILEDFYTRLFPAKVTDAPGWELTPQALLESEFDTGLRYLPYFGPYPVTAETVVPAIARSLLVIFNGVPALTQVLAMQGWVNWLNQWQRGNLQHFERTSWEYEQHLIPIRDGLDYMVARGRPRHEIDLLQRHIMVLDALGQICSMAEMMRESARFEKGDLFYAARVIQPQVIRLQAAALSDYREMTDWLYIPTKAQAAEFNKTFVTHFLQAYAEALPTAQAA